MLWLLFLLTPPLGAQPGLLAYFCAPSPGPAGLPALKLQESLRGRDVASLLQSVRAQESLGPGFHLIALPQGAGGERAALLIPASRGSTGRMPLAVVSTPACRGWPPDELPLRALYASYLEAGFGILAPLHPPMDLPSRQAPPLGPLLARVATLVPLDWERIVLVAPLLPQRVEPRQVPLAYLFRGETTALAALHLIAPGGRAPKAPGDLLAWAGRLIYLHLSPHAPDPALLLLNKLRTLQKQGLLRLLEKRDPALDWEDALRLEPPAVASLVRHLRRPHAPRSLRFQAGGFFALRHEWLELIQAPRSFLLRARLEAKGLAITAAGPGGQTPLPTLVYLPRLPSSLPPVLWNGRKTRVQRPPPAAEILLLARFELQTGRQAQAVLRIGP